MKVTNNDKQLIFEDATIIFRHFSGTKDDFHAEGDRDFCIPLDDAENVDVNELAEALRAEGWNVKTKDYDDHTSTWLNKIKVSYKVRPPQVYVLTRDADGNMRKKELTAETIASLDYAEIAKVDVIVDKHFYQLPRNKEVNCNGYVRSMYVTLVDDPLAAKYAGC